MALVVFHRKLCLWEIPQVVGIRIHLRGIILTDFTDGCSFGSIVLLIWVIDPGVLVLDVCDAFPFLGIDLAFGVRNGNPEVVVHALLPRYI